MATYVCAEVEVVEMLAAAVEKYNPSLKEAGVRLGCLMAHAPRNEKTGELKGHAIMLHGWPALATVRIVSLKDRVAGMPDAMVLLDGDKWAETALEEQDAILDHEITHLLLVRDKDGRVKTDDAFRPRLKMRPHDAQLGIFYDVIARHGGKSIDLQAVADVHRHLVQQSLFPAE